MEGVTLKVTAKLMLMIIMVPLKKHIHHLKCFNLETMWIQNNSDAIKPVAIQALRRKLILSEFKTSQDCQRDGFVKNIKAQTTDLTKPYIIQLNKKITSIINLSKLSFRCYAANIVRAFKGNIYVQKLLYVA